MTRLDYLRLRAWQAKSNAWQQCKRKEHYTTLEAAFDAAAKTGEGLYPYRCRMCNRYCIGHKTKGKFNEPTAQR